MKNFNGSAIFIAVVVVGIVTLAVTTAVSISNSIDAAIEEAAIKENSYLDTQLNPEWEEITVRRQNGNLVGSVGRTKTPTGWLIYSHQNVTFVPDPDHKWLATKVEQDK